MVRRDLPLWLKLARVDTSLCFCHDYGRWARRHRSALAPAGTSRRAINVRVYSFEVMKALLWTREMMSRSESLNDVLRVDDW